MMNPPYPFARENTVCACLLASQCSSQQIVLFRKDRQMTGVKCICWPYAGKTKVSIWRQVQFQTGKGWEFLLGEVTRFDLLIWLCCLSPKMDKHWAEMQVFLYKCPRFQQDRTELCNSESSSPVWIQWQFLLVGFLLPFFFFFFGLAMLSKK